MADEPRIVISSEAGLTAEEIARRTFATAFRGFDAPEVRSFLKRVAEAFGSLQEDVKMLRQRVDEVERARKTAPAELDEDELTAALGAETARVLRSAREAAADIQAKAEQKVARMVKEAEEEAARLREEAEGVLGRRVDEAEEVAGGIRRAAEADAEAARARAKAGAEAEIEQAKAHGREVLTEAQALRERVLGDLARRRKVALAQVEQLRAGRERLLDAYRVVRRTLDEVTEELSAAEAQARVAAEAAGRKVASEPEVTIEELEAELAAARTASLGPGTESMPTAEVEEPPATEPQASAEPAEPAEAEPPPTDSSEDAPVVPLEERRSSTLRIIRRPKGKDRQDEVELEVVQPSAADEGVRVIRPVASEAEPAPEPAEPEVAVEPSPEEPAPVPDVVAAAPGLAAEAEAEASSNGSHPKGERPDIDGLFARIRADREAAVADAKTVLDDTADDVAATEEPERDDEVEPERVVSDADEALLQRRDALLDAVDKALTRRLKRALQDDQNNALDRLRTARGARQLEDIVAEEAAHAQRYRDIAADILRDAAAAGATFAGRAEAVAGVGDQADDLALELVVPLRERLGRNLADAASAGDDDAALVERVSTTYREFKSGRIEPLARQAVATVFARNVFAATPDGTALRWVVDDEGGACPDCDDDALAGPTPKGDAFPTGQLHPPAHPGCRCLLAPE